MIIPWDMLRHSGFELLLAIYAEDAGHKIFLKLWAIASIAGSFLFILSILVSLSIAYADEPYQLTPEVIGTATVHVSAEVVEVVDLDSCMRTTPPPPKDCAEIIVEIEPAGGE